MKYKVRLPSQGFIVAVQHGARETGCNDVNAYKSITSWRVVRHDAVVDHARLTTPSVRGGPRPRCPTESFNRGKHHIDNIQYHQQWRRCFNLMSSRARSCRYGLSGLPCAVQSCRHVALCDPINCGELLLRSFPK